MLAATCPANKIRFFSTSDPSLGSHCFRLFTPDVKSYGERISSINFLSIRGGSMAPIDIGLMVGIDDNKVLLIYDLLNGLKLVRILKEGRCTTGDRLNKVVPSHYCGLLFILSRARSSIIIAKVEHSARWGGISIDSANVLLSDSCHSGASSHGTLEIYLLVEICVDSGPIDLSILGHSEYISIIVLTEKKSLLNYNILRSRLDLYYKNSDRTLSAFPEKNQISPNSPWKAIITSLSPGSNSSDIEHTLDIPNIITVPMNYDNKIPTNPQSDIPRYVGNGSSDRKSPADYSRNIRKIDDSQCAHSPEQTQDEFLCDKLNFTTTGGLCTISSPIKEDAPLDTSHITLELNSTPEFTTLKMDNPPSLLSQNQPASASSTTTSDKLELLPVIPVTAIKANDNNAELHSPLPYIGKYDDVISAVADDDRALIQESSGKIDATTSTSKLNNPSPHTAIRYTKKLLIKGTFESTSQLPQKSNQSRKSEHVSKSSQATEKITRAKSTTTPWYTRNNNNLRLSPGADGNSRMSNTPTHLPRNVTSSAPVSSATKSVPSPSHSTPSSQSSSLKKSSIVDDSRSSRPKIGPSAPSAQKTSKSLKIQAQPANNASVAVDSIQLSEASREKFEAELTNSILESVKSTINLHIEGIVRDSLKEVIENK